MKKNERVVRWEKHILKIEKELEGLDNAEKPFLLGWFITKACYAEYEKTGEDKLLLAFINSLISSYTGVKNNSKYRIGQLEDNIEIIIEKIDELGKERSE